MSLWKLHSLRNSGVPIEIDQSKVIARNSKYSKQSHGSLVPER